MCVGLCTDRHDAESMTFLRGSRCRHVINHDTTIAHRRLYGNRLAGFRIDIFSGSVVNDAIGHSLRKHNVTQVLML